MVCRRNSLQGCMMARRAQQEAYFEDSLKFKLRVCCSLVGELGLPAVAVRDRVRLG